MTDDGPTFRIVGDLEDPEDLVLAQCLVCGWESPGFLTFHVAYLFGEAHQKWHGRGNVGPPVDTSTRGRRR